VHAVTRRSFSVEVQMEKISLAINKASGTIIDGLETQGWAMVDGLLDENLCKEMRAEAVELYDEGYFATSQSTKWDTESNSSVTYDKHNVFSMQLDGGEQYYVAPQLHHYMVTMTKTLQPILAERFPEAQLSSTMMSNKLAVCTGDGSAYDKHYDNSGMDDTRKVTVLYYMNNWRPEMEGQFRIYQSPAQTASCTSLDKDVVDKSGASTIDVDPVGNRLLVFWSDRLVHSVQRSVAPAGVADHRYALTLWLTCITPDAIYRDDAEALEHFGIL
jgi:hypothetical protein